jgi:hypothetical protein
MHGIVSLLDNDYYQLVEELWAELEREFSVQGVYVTPYPHFSYHVAQVYDVDKIEPVLQRITSNITTFKVRTSGLAIFTGASPVLYIPVVRSLELTQLHQELWEQISTASSGIVEYYHPEQWMPHITIGFGDISKENLSQIIPFLAERDFNWEITVNNLAFIYDTGTKQEMKSRFDITNEPVPGESSMEGLHWQPVTEEVVEGLRQIQDRIMQESQGHVFEDSAELIRQMREERTRQLMGEDEE